MLRKVSVIKGTPTALLHFSGGTALQKASSGWFPHAGGIVDAMRGHNGFAVTFGGGTNQLQLQLRA